MAILVATIVALAAAQVMTVDECAAQTALTEGDDLGPKNGNGHTIYGFDCVSSLTFGVSASVGTCAADTRGMLENTFKEQFTKAIEDPVIQKMMTTADVDSSEFTVTFPNPSPMPTEAELMEFASETAYNTFVESCASCFGTVLTNAQNCGEHCTDTANCCTNQKDFACFPHVFGLEGNQFMSCAWTADKMRSIFCKAWLQCVTFGFVRVRPSSK
jgi:hypothetical protein